jgi:hypothetical protein
VLALAANPAFFDSVFDVRLRENDELIKFWATLLDGDSCTMKLIIHEVVSRIYDGVAEEEMGCDTRP